MPKLKSAGSRKSASSKIPEAPSDGYVYVEKGVTKNMGDYNSARVTIGITVPLNPTAAQLEEAKQTVQKSVEVVDSLLENEVVQLLDELD